MTTPPPFLRAPDRTLEVPGGAVHVFDSPGGNGDESMVRAFGEEWTKFHSVSPEDLHTAGNELFDVLPTAALGPGTRMLDAGCGSGRWTSWLADRVGHVDAIDPSRSVLKAASTHAGLRHVRWSMARMEDLPFPDSAFDLVLCIGVLHHLGDQGRALRESVRVLRPGGHYYVYMYYALENRGPLFRLAHRCSDLLRRGVHRLPGRAKRFVCDVLAVVVYAPMVGAVRLLKAFGGSAWEHLPLAYYHNKSFRLMRNDALDRFGTCHEQRSTRGRIRELLTSAGLEEVCFSERPPYWHAVARKAAVPTA